MSLTNQNFSLIFSLFCIAFGLPFIIAAPASTRDDPFDKFIEFLSIYNCSMPKEVKLPFSSTDSTAFSYLSTPLKECQSSEALKENNKANLLCKEVFEVLQNITCREYNLPLPKINSGHLSENVCKDFAAIQDIIPKQNEYLSRKLGDSIICKVLCTEKYELLCKTLLWSYDTQAKIKKAEDSQVKENMNENVNYIATNNDDLDNKVKTIIAETGIKNHPEIKEISDNVASKLEDTKKLQNGSSISNLESEPYVSKSSSNDQSNMNGNISTLSSLQNISQEAPSSSPRKVLSESVPQKVSPNNQNEDIQVTKESPVLVDTALNGNEIENQNRSIKIGNPVNNASPNTKVNGLTSTTPNSQNGKSDTLLIVPSKGHNENNANSNINIKPDEKSSSLPKTEIENDMNNDGFQEPTESKTNGKEKQTDFIEKGEKTKEGFISDGTTADVDSKLSESTVVPIYPDKNEDNTLEQHPDIKDSDQYNDSENDGDYAKQEYDSSSLKKEIDIKNSEEGGSSQFSSSANTQISPDNFPGQRLDGSRNYLSDQEDSHFFFYFLSIVLILMAGYLIFHNKQKIIALIVEGRHERRRRSHGAGYKKLETK